MGRFAGGFSISEFFEKKVSKWKTIKIDINSKHCKPTSTVSVNLEGDETKALCPYVSKIQDGGCLLLINSAGEYKNRRIHPIHVQISFFNEIE